MTPTTDTSLSTAQANILASSTAAVARLNVNLTSIFSTGFNNWKISVDAGRIDNTTPPQVPNGYQLSKPDKDGFVWPEIGTTPVCAMPPIPESQVGLGTGLQALQPNTIDIGAQLAPGSAFYAAGPKDTWPPNNQTPPLTLPDGSTHVFVKIPAPVGTVYITLPDGTKVAHGGWYEIIF